MSVLFWQSGLGQLDRFAVLGFRVACVQASIVCSFGALSAEEGDVRAFAVFARRTVAGAMQ